MKTFLTLLAAVSFVFLAVLGFLGANDHFGMGHGCLASSAYNSSCMAADAFAVTLFHINFLKSFSNAIIVLLVIAFLSVFVFAGSVRNLIFAGIFPESSVFDPFKKPLLPVRHRFSDWFAVLRENIAA